MTKKKPRISPILKATLTFAGPDFEDATQDTHDDLYTCWGLVRAVFGRDAKPEHAIALLPHYTKAVGDDADADPLAPETPRGGVELEDDEDPDDEDDDEEDDTDREIVDMPITPEVDLPRRRTRH